MQVRCDRGESIETARVHVKARDGGERAMQLISLPKQGEPQKDKLWDKSQK